MKKIRIFLALAALAITSPGFSQGEANWWHFGYNAGLNFPFGPPVAFGTSLVNTSEGSASISPDGTLAAFTLSESAVQSDIWIRNYPAPTGKWQVSSTSGQAARWSRDGKYVYFWKSVIAAADSLFRARVDRSPTIVVRAPEFVLSLPVDGDPNNWDLHPDGKRFVVTVADLTPIPSAGGTETAAAPVSRYLVVQNWFSELKAITAKAGK